MPANENGEYFINAFWDKNQEIFIFTDKRCLILNKTTLTIESQHSYESLTKNIESTELCIKGYKYEGDFILAFNMNVDLG